MGLSKYIVSYLFVMCSLISQSQSFYKVIGTTGTEYVEAVVNDRDSGFVIVGGTEGLGQGEMDGYMVKLDTAGNVLWTRTFGYENVDRLTSVKLLDDGMMLCGHANVSGDYQMYLIRTNENGQVVWEKTIGSSGWEFPSELVIFNDTIALVVGELYQDGETTTDAFISAVTINGDSLWTKYYGGNFDDALERIIVSDSNQLYVCGSNEMIEGDTDYWVGRIDEQGNFLWELLLGDTLEDHAHGITEVITGEFIVTGEDRDTSATSIDNVFYKIDSNGNVLFQNVINNSGDDIGIDVISYPDTNTFTLVSNSTSVGVGGFDSWVFECNYWTYLNSDYDFGTEGNDWAVDADTTFDKGTIVVGNLVDPNLGNVIFVNKATSELNYLETYQTIEDLAVEIADEVKGGIYPNPTKNEIYLEASSKYLNKTYSILNVEGRIVLSGLLKGNKITIDLLPGYYLLNIDDVVWKFVVSD